MKTNCPNKSHPDFKKLVEEFGELDATYAYFLNDEDIPSVDVAGKLLGKSVLTDVQRQNIQELKQLEPAYAQASDEVVQKFIKEQDLDYSDLSLAYTGYGMARGNQPIKNESNSASVYKFQVLKKPNKSTEELVLIGELHIGSVDTNSGNIPYVDLIKTNDYLNTSKSYNDPLLTKSEDYFGKSITSRDLYRSLPLVIKQMNETNLVNNKLVYSNFLSEQGLKHLENLKKTGSLKFENDLQQNYDESKNKEKYKFYNLEGVPVFTNTLFSPETIQKFKAFVKKQSEKTKPTAIWGMATTGKTHLAEKQPDKYIDFDTYLKPVKKEIKQLYKEDKVAEAEALIISQWKTATEQAKKEGKQLLGSQQALLSSEEDVIDEIYYNDNYDDFRNKILNRNDEESTSEDDIKSRFDSNIDRINKYSGKAKKNVSTNYLSELFDKEELSTSNIRLSFESPRIKPLEAVLARFNINNGITSVPANRLIVDGLINEQYMLANEVTIDDLAPLFIDQIMNSSTARSHIEKYFPKNFNESSLQVRKEILTNMLDSNKAFNKEFIKQVIEIMNSKGMNVNEYTLLSDIIGKHNDIRYMSDESDSAAQSVSPIYGTLPMNKQTEVQRKISELFMKTDSMFDSKNPYIEIDVSTMTKQEKKELADVIKGAKTVTRYRLTNEKDGRKWVLKRVTDLQKKLSNKYKSAKEIEEQEEKSSIYADTGTILHTIMEDTILNSLTKFDDKIYAMFIDTLNNLKSLTDSSLSDISEKIYQEMLVSKDYQTIRNNFLNSDKSPFASFYYYKDAKTGKMVRKDIKEYPAKNYNKIAESSVSAYIDILSRQAIKDWKNNSSKPVNEQVWNRANIFTERRSFDEKESEVGTMDFLAVYSDGNYGIMDYKFMKAVMKITEDSNGKNRSELNKELLMDSYFRSKEQAYSNQLSRYSEMMKTVYKGKDLEFARINPTYIGYSLNDQGKVDSNSKIINLFMSDEVSGLIPISKERTGNRTLDLFLDEIEKQTEIIANDLSKRKAWTTDFITVNRLTELKKILMSIQSRGDLSGYTHYAMDFIKNVNKTIKNKPESLTNKALNNITDELAFISYFLNNTSNIMIDYKEKYPDEYDRFASQISSLFVNLSEIKTKLDELKVSRLREEARKLGMLDSVFDSYKDATDISGAQNMLLSMKSINHPLVQVFSKKLDVLNAQRIALQKRIKEDHDVYYESLKKWGESRGLKGTDIYKPMLTDNKQLITPYSSKYKTDTENYKDLSNEENLIWWKDNFYRSKESFNGRKSDEDRFQEAKKHHKEKLEIAYSEHDDKVEKINGLMDAWSEKNDIYNPKFNNWYECYFKSPKNRDKYLSDTYLNIMKPENKPLRDYYEYLIKMNEQFKAMMGGDVNINYNFVPNIRKSMLDTASQDALGGTGIFKNYWDSISNSIMRNPEDKLGDNTKEIPILFIDFIDVESKSIDLGKNLMMFGTFVNQYKHAKELLEISNMIEYTLINTPLAVKDKKGNKVPSMSSSSNFETVSGANSNLVKAIQTYRDYYMYGETTKRDAVSEVLGDKGVRLVQAAQSKVSSMSMSFNFVSATVGSLNARTQIATIASAGKYFTDKQFANAMKITETFSAKLMWADLFFEANGDSTNTVKKANELSANSLVRNFSENYGYWYQKYVDNLDEKVLLHAMLNNYGIDPNTGVTVRLEKLEEKYGKDPKYTGVKFKSIWESIELIDENDKTKGYRIVNQHTGKPIEIVMETGSELEEETNTQNTNTFASMRRKVMEMNSRIKGSVSKEDMSSFRMSVVGRLLGQFRNWMPATLNERLKKEQYNMTMEEFEVGRWTSLYNVGKTNFTNTAKQFLVALIPFRNHSFDAIDTPELRARYDQFIQNNPGVKDLVSYDDFVKEYKGQLRTFARELKFYGMIFLLGMILVSMLKGSGDDEEERGFILNSFSTLQERLQMELGFYIPIAGLPEFLKLATKDPFPIVRGITDSLKLITNTADETRDIFVGENDKKDTKPLFHFTSRFLGVGNVARYSGLTDTTNDNDSLGEWLFGGREHGKI